MRLAIVAIFVIACGDRAVPPPPVPPGGIELLVMGVAPEPIRYAPLRDARSRIELQLALEVTAGGRTTTLPPLVLTLEVTIADVLADGSALVKTAIVDARAAEGGSLPAAVASPSLTTMVGAVFEQTLSPTGTIVTATRGGGDAAATQLAHVERSLARITPALPEVPVGVGAIWTQRQELVASGARLVATTQTLLARRDGDRVTLATTTTLSGPDQTVELEGVAIQLRDVGGTGTARTTIDLVRTTLEGTTTLELRGHMESPGSDVAPITMAMTVTARPVE
jgi:hypothetical protein